MLKASPVPIYSDNYVWVIHAPSGNEVCVVDPGDAKPVLGYLRAQGLRCIAVLITHSHWDHITGLPEFLGQWDVPVYGPDSPAIPQVTHRVHEGDTLSLWNIDISVMELPGHMPEHLGYLLRHEGSHQLLCGDVLFSAGCGRIFSGTFAELKNSLDRLAKLPPDTLVYCTHEYTLSNLAFAKAVEPTNTTLIEYEHKVRDLRQQKQPSLPTTIELEKKINPFLRYQHPDVIKQAKKKMNRAPKSPLDVFTALRQWKNSF